MGTTGRDRQFRLVKRIGLIDALAMSPNPLRWQLHWQILLSLTLAVLCALLLLPNSGDAFPVIFLEFCGQVGQLFMSALKMVIVPLVAASIIAGVMQLGADKGAGRMGGKTLLYYTLSGTCAVIIGLIVVNLIGPGRIDPEAAAAMLGQGGATAAEQGILDKVEGRDSRDLVGILLRLFPDNIFAAATSNGSLLGIITFSLLFGLCIGQLPPALRTAQENFWESTQQVMLQLTSWIIRFAPIGVFGLVTPVLYNAPIGQLFGAILAFFFTVVLALALHTFVVLALALKGLGRVPAMAHYKAMAPVLLTAFSTSSSSATLPLTMDTVEKRAGVSAKTCAFTLPLGATVNMDGTALYECVVVLFIAQLYAATGQPPLEISQQLAVVFLALTTSIGVAGIPAASLVAIAIILPAVGLPIEALGVVWVADRILDMCRTAVNVFSDTVGAVVIARSEGEVLYKGNKEAA